MASAQASSRDRIFDVARELFYRHGYRAVGVDTIVEASGVAKTTLYRWFPTKDDLIVAVLESRDAEFWAQWDHVASRYEGQDARAREQLRAQLQWITSYITGNASRGCTFLNAAAEFPEADHPARAAVRRNKQQLRQRLLGLVRATGARPPERVADQLCLLVDGAFANSEAFGKQGPATGLTAAADALLAAAVRQG